MTQTADTLSMNRPWQSQTIVKAAILAAAVFFLHWYTLITLAQRWYSEGDYTYGFFVPLVSLYLIWSERESIFKIRPRPMRLGFLIIGLALFSQFAGALSNIGYLQALSLVVLLAGLILALGGSRLFLATAFPVFYLLIMIPPPGAVHDRLAFPLQLLASRTSADILELLGIPVARDGNVFRLPNITLAVAEACSGLRSLSGLLAMGILLGYLTTRRLWERIVLALSTVPIAVTANILRVLGTGLICEYVGVKWGQGFYHGFSAWIVFIFALAALFIESAILSALFPPGEASPPNALDTGANVVAPERKNKPENKAHYVYCLTTVLLAAIGLHLVQYKLKELANIQSKPLPIPLAQFAMDLNGWRATSTDLDPDVQKVIGVSDYWTATYRDPQGRGVSLFLALYPGESIGKLHQPKICYPAAGWTTVRADHVGLDLFGETGGSIDANRLEFIKGNFSQVVLYWYHIPDGTIADPSASKFHRLFGILRGKNNRSMVKVQVGIPMGKSVDETVEYAGPFLRLVEERLAEHLGPDWAVPGAKDEKTPSGGL